MVGDGGTMRDDIAEALHSGRYDQLRYLWCDNGNVIRAKTLFVPTFLARHGHEGALTCLGKLEEAVTITAAMQAMPATRDAPAPDAGLAPVQDVRLAPDWQTFAAAPNTARIASVLCDMIEGDRAWALCPRSYLRRMIEALAARDIALEVGYEIEFCLLHPDEDPDASPRPVDRTVYAQSSAAQASRTVISAILRSLWDQGVPVEQYNAESGPGQHEITLEYGPPLLMADRLVRARETIRAAARDQGLVASFLPLIFEGGAGNGLHVHMSLWRDGRNLMGGGPGTAWGLSQAGNAFMAGILQHLPALMATTTPTRNSFRRIRPHAWSGAYQAWGIANKEAALRTIGDSRTGTPTNFELKTVDATANPYIALGCVIAAGLDGLETAAQLPEPIPIDPGDYSPEQRETLGIAALPTHLEAALACFDADQTLRAAMQPRFADVFAAVRRAELASLDGLTFDQERALLLERF